MDFSHLDKKYFIDPYKYNCSFCKRNHVSYDLEDTTIFDWSMEKECIVYLIKCNSCNGKSIHFSFNDIRSRDHYGRPENYFKTDLDIDENFIFSRPSSFFVLDNRIPKIIRDLVFEAEQCLQGNFLVGSSACIRKAIYVLLDYEKCIEINESSGKANYADSIKKLKSKVNFVTPQLFDAIGQIQELTSDNMHEGSWASWDSKHLKFLIELLKTVLNEMYVIPEEKKKSISVLTELKKVFEKDKDSVKTKK